MLSARNHSKCGKSHAFAPWRPAQSCGLEEPVSPPSAPLPRQVFSQTVKVLRLQGYSVCASSTGDPLSISGGICDSHRRSGDKRGHNFTTPGVQRCLRAARDGRPTKARSAPAAGILYPRTIISPPNEVPRQRRGSRREPNSRASEPRASGPQLCASRQHSRLVIAADPPTSH